MRKVTEERIERLEKNSEYHRKFMYATHKELVLLLDHLQLRIKNIEEHQVIEAKGNLFNSWRKETEK